MTRDELEMSISRYADGALDEDARVEVEALLASDPSAQTLLAEEQKLTAMLRSDPLPEIHWEGLAESISMAIDEEAQERFSRASAWLRWRMPAGLAAAASVLIAASLIAVRLLSPTDNQPVAVNPTQVAPSPVLIVLGPQTDQPEGTAVVNITVSAGGTYAKESSLAPYADELDSRPSRVVIASGVNPDQAPIRAFPY